MRSKALLTLFLAAVLAPREAAAQLDPLLFLKTTVPNVILAVDTSNRMLRDANNDFLDANVYTKSAIGALDQVLLVKRDNVNGLNTCTSSTYYRRKYMGLAYSNPGSDDKFTATKINVVCQEESDYSTFDEGTRLAIARRGLIEAVNRNTSVARFGLLKMRQSSPAFSTELNSGPVKLDDVLQSAPIFGDGGNKWNITRSTVTTATDNGEVATSTTPCSGTLPNTQCLVKAVDTSTNSTVVTRLTFPTSRSSHDLTTFYGSLVPGGNDINAFADTPIDLMVEDIKNEAVQLANADDLRSLTASPYRQCRPTVGVLVVGGKQGDSSPSGSTPAGKAALLLDVGTGHHRVPVYVIAIAPASTDNMSAVQAVATTSGGKYTVITAAQIAATTPGQPVPEFVHAVNEAIQHAFAKQSDCDTDPTTALPYGPYTEHQTTSPIVGTVYMKDAHDINGNSLNDSTTSFNETYITNASGEIPQRSNVLITSGFSLPGFDGKMRAFRTYKPELDASKPTGYKFTNDGRRLWVACAPGTATTGLTTTPCTSLTTSQRNIYTALPDGTVVAFTTANAATLKDYLLPSSRHSTATTTTAEELITFIRSQPFGAIVGSTPAIMDAPSLDPPPDGDYPAFKVAHEDRRSLVWIGTNDGMLHAIDGRLGVEVWAFIPFNLLPKLYTLRSGQPVGDFRYFVDSSPKIAEVKIDVDGTGEEWRTVLVMGEGAGGTFYQTFDVTMDDMATAKASDTIADVLADFNATTDVPLLWAFPRYSVFDATLGCTTNCTGSSPTQVWGELSSTASTAEKSVGETWSDPAVGQIGSTDGPFTVLTGSGFYKYSQQATYRGGTPAGTRFYVLNAEDGTVLDSKDVGKDNFAESGTGGDSCAAAGDCTRLKNALQADPVATGPSDSRFITKAYIGDLDGRLWRFDISLNASDVPQIATPVKLYDAGREHPMFTSMATVNVGTTQQYLFQGTGSELLPVNGVSQQYKLLVILDTGTGGTKKAEILLTKTDSTGDDEKVSAFPAVAGDIVFFATTSYKPETPCTFPDANLYAFTFIGGPAYDTNGDGTVTSGSKKGTADSTKVRTTTGARATAPFIVDQHLVFGTGSTIEMFGDEQDFNNGVGQVGVRILSWREVR